MAATSYLIGLGGNRMHGRHGRPEHVLRAALAVLTDNGFRVVAASRIGRSRPLGPASRDFANAVALIDTALDPPAVLARLKAIERRFGRRAGRRWGARVLDLDILAWSGGAWPPAPRAPSRALAVPHPALTARGFALAPAAALAPGWRLPRAGTLRAAETRRRRPRPVDHAGSRT